MSPCLILSGKMHLEESYFSPLCTYPCLHITGSVSRVSICGLQIDFSQQANSRQTQASQKFVFRKLKHSLHLCVAYHHYYTFLLKQFYKFYQKNKQKAQTNKNQYSFLHGAVVHYHNIISSHSLNLIQRISLHKAQNYVPHLGLCGSAD